MGDGWLLFSRNNTPPCMIKAARAAKLKVATMPHFASRKLMQRKKTANVKEPLTVPRST